jgi:DNA polymerase-3 subunit epsilon
MRALILDTETDSLDPKSGQLLEVGAVVWSVTHRSIVSAYSGLIHAASNDARDANGIDPALLLELQPVPENSAPIPVAAAAKLAAECECVIAHNAAFDRPWFERYTHPSIQALLALPWVCTIEDFAWPKPSPSRSLSAIALAHGCAVVSAHRAIHDCLLLARALEAVPDVLERMIKAIAHAQLERAEFVSRAPFEQKDLCKAHGFHWDPARRGWFRTMAVVDVESLPFSCARM